jgi:hypothetical protein
MALDCLASMRHLIQTDADLLDQRMSTFGRACVKTLRWSLLSAFAGHERDFGDSSASEKALRRAGNLSTRPMFSAARSKSRQNAPRAEIK